MGPFLQLSPMPKTPSLGHCPNSSDPAMLKVGRWGNGGAMALGQFCLCLGVTWAYC